jgi:RNA polymerase sigma factor (sigma-70 family)
VYDRYATVVYGVTLKILVERSAAEEATKEVFLELWRRPRRFDPELGPLRPWLGALAHHTAVAAAHRRAAGRPRHQSPTMDMVVDIDETISSVLITEEVHAALAALPEDERAPIRLAYFGGKSYRQVADDLGIAEETVMARMHSGLRRMSRALPADVLGRDR